MTEARPGWFSAQGFPYCSVWGKSEIERLAWAYVTTQARTGDEWKAASIKQCLECLSPDERAEIPMIRHGQAFMRPTFERQRGWWDQVGRHLLSADDAFEIGGSWTKRRFKSAFTDK